MGRHRGWAVTMERALTEAPDAAATTAALAEEHRLDSDGEAQVVTRWWPEAGCHLTLTHQRLDASTDDAHRLASILYSAARLERQPWYPQFRRGTVGPGPVRPLPEGLRRACTACSTFDVGLGTPRAYRVLCTDIAFGPHTTVLGLRSIVEGPAAPERAVEAFLGPPSGDVLHHDGEALHWHHVLLTPGVGLRPTWFDHGLLRTLRNLGWDGAERATLKGEAEGLVRFVAETDLARFCDEHAIDLA